MPTKTPDQDEFNRIHNVGDDDWEKRMESYDSRHHEAANDASDPRGEGADELRDRENQAAGNASDPRGESSEEIGSREEQGDSSFINNVTEESAETSGKAKGSRTKSLVAGISLSLTGISLILSIIFGGASALLTLKEVLTQKFDARMNSLNEKRTARHMWKKMGKDMTKGCTIKVKCRFKGMSEREIKKFEKRNPGTTIERGKCFGAGPVKKCSVKSIEFINDKGEKQTTQAKDFKKTFKSNKSLRDNVRKFNNSKVATWRDKAAGKMFKKFKLFRGKLKEEKSSNLNNEKNKEKATKERVKASTSGENFDISVDNTPAADDDPQKADKDRLNGVSDELAGDIKEGAGEISPDASKSTRTQLTKKLISKISNGPLAAAGAICMIRDVIKAATIAVKFKASLTLMRYAMLFMSAADQMKYGDSKTTSDANAIGEVAEVLQKKDPGTDNASAKGRTAFDSVGYQYAAYGNLPTKNGKLDKDQYNQYSKFILGGGTSGKINDLTNNVVFKSLCGTIGFASRMIFGLPGLKQLSEGAAKALQPVMAPIFGAAVGALVGVMSDTLINGDENGNEAGNAITAGFGQMSANNARARGAFPLSKDKALAYDQDTKLSEEQTIKDGGLAYQFDSANANSFMGRLASATLPITAQLSSPSLSSVSSIISAPSLSLQSLTSTVHAKDGDNNEYDFCPDDDYNDELKVATDLNCNVQYGLNPADVTADDGDTYDSENVLAYMCGASLDDDVSCTTKGFIDDDGNPIEDSEYGKFIKNCIETDQPLNSSDMRSTNQSDGLDKHACEDPKKTGDETKYTMFRMYYFDTTIDDQFNDRGDQDGTNNGKAPSEDSSGDSTDDTDSGTVSGDIAELAKTILEHKGKEVIFSDNEFGNDSKDRSNPSEQLEDISNGKKANLSTRCDYASSLPKSVAPNKKILQFLADLAESGNKFEINALFGQCHSGSGSQHHKGNAVDFACTTTPFDTTKADKVGAKYGVKRNFETCAGQSHWHYSVGGN